MLEKNFRKRFLITGKVVDLDSSGASDLKVYTDEKFKALIKEWSNLSEEEQKKYEQELIEALEQDLFDGSTPG